MNTLYTGTKAGWVTCNEYGRGGLYVTNTWRGAEGIDPPPSVHCFHSHGVNKDVQLCIHTKTPSEYGSHHLLYHTSVDKSAESQFICYMNYILNVCSFRQFNYNVGKLRFRHKDNITTDIIIV